jgi:hypothetical protein
MTMNTGKPNENELLTSAERARLLTFLGFGNAKAPVVFIGMEEGLTETLDYPLIAQLKDRARLATVADLRDSRVHPGKYLMGSRPPIQSTWNVLIRVLLALEENRRPTNDQVRFYQRDLLGTSGGMSLLLEFMPLPARHIDYWSPYDEYFPEFRNRNAYWQAIAPRRTVQIREHLSYGPDLVIAYGSGYWPQYAELFPSIERWQSRGVFAFGRAGGTAVLMMPHPTARQMNGNREALCELSLELLGPASDTWTTWARG